MSTPWEGDVQTEQNRWTPTRETFSEPFDPDRPWDFEPDLEHVRPLGYVRPVLASTLSTPSTRRERSHDLSRDEQRAIRSEAERFVNLSIWRRSAYRPRYRRGDGVRVRRYRYRCPSGCYPGILASRFHVLGWTYLVTLTAPPGSFSDWWRDWRGLQMLEALVPWNRTEHRPFWVYGLSGDVVAADRVEGLHVHILTGNVPYAALARIVSSWPVDGFSRSAKIQKVTHRWGALHYLFSQTKNTWAHSRDDFANDALNSRCACGLLLPPVFSDMVDLLADMTWNQIRETAGRRSSQDRSRSWRSRRARRAANARWSRRTL